MKKGWVSPKGDFYDFDVAEKLAKSYVAYKGNPKATLLDAGFVLIQNTCVKFFVDREVSAFAKNWLTRGQLYFFDIHLKDFNSKQKHWVKEILLNEYRRYGGNRYDLHSLLGAGISVPDLEPHQYTYYYHINSILRKII